MQTQCANFNCNNTPFGNRIRCGYCRRYDINTCCDCDEPTTRGAVYCKSCKMNHRTAFLKIFHNNRKIDFPECRMCFQQLPMRKMRYCKGECNRIFTNLDRYVRQGKKNESNV
jgi:hypothetical protein